MHDFIGNFAQGLPLPQGERAFFRRIMQQMQRGHHQPLPEEWGGLLLANTTEMLWAIAHLAIGKRNRHRSCPSSNALSHMTQFGKRPEFRIGDPTVLQAVLLVHSLTVVCDFALLAAEIGRAFRLATALNVPMKVLLACKRWQEKNRGLRTAIEFGMTFRGNRLSPEFVDASFDNNLLYRERFYRALGIEVLPTDPGTTIDEGPLEDMVQYYAALSARLAGRELTAEDRANPDVLFIEHLANAAGRRSKSMIDVSADFIRYYLIQTIAQAPFLGKAVKSCPDTEGSFNRCHAFGIDSRRWFPEHPDTHGILATIEDEPHRTRAGAILAYNGVSGDPLRNPRQGAELETSLRGFIPLDNNDQTVDDIAGAQRGMPVIQVSRLAADWLSFLQLCHLRQPAILAQGCRAAGLTGGMDEVLAQFDDDHRLVNGWHEAAACPWGQSTRDWWTDSLDSFRHKGAAKSKAMPPHMGMMFRSEVSDEFYRGTSTLAAIIRNYYQTVVFAA
jgi:hypothetical protein